MDQKTIEDFYKARSQDTAQSQLRTFGIFHHDPLVRWGVATNPITTSATLGEMLPLEGDLDTIRAIMEHPNVTLRMMLNSVHHGTEEAATAAVLSSRSTKQVWLDALNHHCYDVYVLAVKRLMLVEPHRLVVARMDARNGSKVAAIKVRWLTFVSRLHGLFSRNVE